MNNFRKNILIKNNDTIFRVLEVDNNRSQAFVIDCIHPKMPAWIPTNTIEQSGKYEEITETDLLKELNIVLPDEYDLSIDAVKTMSERFNVVTDILPHIINPKQRNKIILEKSKEYDVSRQTIINYLLSFLVCQNKLILSPKPNVKRKTLSEDERNFRWALNKFFYTKNKLSLMKTYKNMIAEKYCDSSGRLFEYYPSFYQFKYFFKKYNKRQTFLISRNGLTNYQRNSRPLLGNGVQEFASNVGIGMLDSTVCDIYLVNSSGQLVGRPILTVCIDAYSSLCCGYALTWEGGIYSLRKLIGNIVTDKKKWCKKFGINIDDNAWNSTELPATLVTDKGTEYKSEVFEQLTELGVRVVNLSAYRPELKGPVEKFFDLIQDYFKPFLYSKGIVEKDNLNRGGHDYRKDACLTLDDFERILLHCIVHYNSKRVLKTYPFTEEMLDNNVLPYANSIFSYGRSLNTANMLSADKRTLLLTLLPRTLGHFDRTGLIVNKMRYKNSNESDNSLFTENYLSGGKVLVAYDPDNVSCVWLLIDNNPCLAKVREKYGVHEKYIEFNLIELRFADKSLKSVQELQEKQKSMIQSFENPDLQGSVDLRNQILNELSHVSKPKVEMTSADIENVSETKAREQKETHSVIKEDISEDE